ncbi:hypothetical protein E2C01_046267 [Portunus trituberculatus]|uniref:Uncharacterized protein n=1 Tax=Portunus trituberculatus TaxID=210409 RepID=A0A5B7G4B4_PORTR|nr:hypothetical protein [Portunus trituberculatus]
MGQVRQTESLPTSSPSPVVSPPPPLHGGLSSSFPPLPSSLHYCEAATSFRLVMLDKHTE